MTEPTSRACWICRQRPATATGALPFVQVCPECRDATRVQDDAWIALSLYLRRHWKDITTRGSFDLSKAFTGDPATAATAATAAATAAANVQLFFVKVLGSKLHADKIAVDLSTFASALLSGKPHPEITLLIADGNVPQGKLYSLDSEVSVLRSGDEVQSALWVFLLHPVAIRICYLKANAPVRAPLDSHPWHPTRQRKVVKLSPYRGDTQPLVARRDLRV
jgi:hypothetical protein